MLHCAKLNVDPVLHPENSVCQYYFSLLMTFNSILIVDNTTTVYLPVSPDPPDSDPKIDGKVKLRCSLRSHSDYRPCKGKRIRWVDESGTELRGEGVGYKLEGQKDCDSNLTVKRQRGHNRKYTCQLVDGKNSVMIDDHYTPDFIGGDQPDISNPGKLTGNQHGGFSKVGVFFPNKIEHRVSSESPQKSSKAHINPSSADFLLGKSKA